MKASAGQCNVCGKETWWMPLVTLWKSAWALPTQKEGVRQGQFKEKVEGLLSVVRLIELDDKGRIA